MNVVVCLQLEYLKSVNMRFKQYDTKDTSLKAAIASHNPDNHTNLPAF